ncbi:hypothetical protein CIB48_g9400 [Xylaria polymorpha]|nr:hypothetical protein CIB48_g9400 [Xylaria polymorpha]
MPKFFCDYCDVYLTHDSMSVRKAHNSGRNHLRNVVDYYQQIGHEKAQSVIDSITSSYAAEGQAHANPMLPQNQPGAHGVGGAPGAFPPPFNLPRWPCSDDCVAAAPPGQQGAGRGGLPPFPPGPGGMPMPPPGGLPFPPPGGLPFPGFPGMPPPGAQGFPGPSPPGAPGFPPPVGGPPGQQGHPGRRNDLEAIWGPEIYKPPNTLEPYYGI